MAKKRTKNKTGRGKAKESKDLVSKELTEEEKARLDIYYKRSEREPLKFKKVESSSGDPTITPQKLDDSLGAVKMSEALGTTDTDLQNHLFSQVIQTFKGTISTDGADYDKAADASNNAMAILNGIQPRDEIEGMLAVQMIGVHNMAMRTMGLAMLGGQTFEGKKSNVNYATKMLRTFMTQMEVLKRYRTGGQQRIVVEHVNVSEGGQAIVGVVNRGGGGNNDKKRG